MSTATLTTCTHPHCAAAIDDTDPDTRLTYPCGETPDAPLCADHTDADQADHIHGCRTCIAECIAAHDYR